MVGEWKLLDSFKKHRTVDEQAQPDLVQVLRSDCLVSLDKMLNQATQAAKVRCFHGWWREILSQRSSAQPAGPDPRRHALDQIRRFSSDRQRAQQSVHVAIQFRRRDFEKRGAVMFLQWVSACRGLDLVQARGSSCIRLVQMVHSSQRCARALFGFVTWRGFVRAEQSLLQLEVSQHVLWLC